MATRRPVSTGSGGFVELADADLLVAGSALDLVDLSADPAAPAAGKRRVFMKSGILYQITSASVVSLVGVQRSTIGADVAFTTTEVILCQLRIPAGTRVVGETWRARLVGTGPLAAGNFTWKVRVGPLGTATGDPAALTYGPAAGTINSRWNIDFLIVMKTATSVRAEGLAVSPTISVPVGAPPAATAVVTSADWFITVTGIMSASTAIATAGAIGLA